MKELDLEHIHPKSSTTLETRIIQRLGNCTLLESVNTQYQKGNRSIKNVSFVEKLSSFRNSSLDLNKDIVFTFGNNTIFGEKCIDKRERLLTEQLFKMTEMYLHP
jgi:hypothetical protein